MKLICCPGAVVNYTPIVRGMDVWTRGLVLGWPSELRFFETRTQLLRELQERHLLTAFLFENERVGAKLGPHVNAEVTSRSVSVDIGSPALDTSHVAEALGIVLAHLRPGRVRLVMAQTQVLNEISLDYDEARGRLASALTGQWVAAGASGTDCAILLDGKSTRTESAFQVHFGVVNKDEVGPRLQRLVGNMPTTTDHATVVDLGGLPECAIFLDWHWMPGKNLESGDIAAEALIMLDEIVAESLRLSEGIQDRAGLGRGTVGITEATN